MIHGDLPAVGVCCSCREAGPTVRNILMFPVRAPVPGTGWGCVVCGLPNSGAIAVLCDRCFEEEREVRDLCHGYPGENVRMARAALTEPFDHDLSQHPPEEWWHL